MRETSQATTQPCESCDGTGQIEVSLRNDRTHTDVTITQTCLDCL
jgi:hypothetical protein